MKAHIHSFVEDGHGMSLVDGQEDWSFHCTYKNCPVGVSLLHGASGWWDAKEDDLSEFVNEKKRFQINLKKGVGCSKCGWEPTKKHTSIERQNRLRNHRKRAHGI